MINCKLNDITINCYDGAYSRDELKYFANKKMLLCPACGKPYEYCHGKIVSAYFRHQEKDQCDRYSEPESQEHLNGKRDLYEWVKIQDGVSDVVLEGWIPDTNQRPDIMFNYKGHKYVIEYQCSPISTEYFERHQLYKSVEVNDIWICGTEKYFQYYHKGSGNKKVTELEEKSKIYYDSSNKKLYMINNQLCEYVFNDIIEGGDDNEHFMKSPIDFKDGYKNFYLLKDKYISYSRFSYYPSPTGRRSNKYQYPVSGYNYKDNKSLAKCLKLNDVTLNYISN